MALVIEVQFYGSRFLLIEKACDYSINKYNNISTYRQQKK